jgi:hypothetical protein
MGTAYTSAATGNWSSSSSWTPTGVPGSGDTATIASGHTITIPDGYAAVVGTSPASGGTTALTIATGGALTIGGGTSGTLTVRGPVVHAGATVTVKAGAILEFDASQATTPLSQKYDWTSNGFGPNGNLFKSLGTSGSPCIVRSNAGGGNGYFFTDAGYNDSLAFDCTHTTFLRIGDSANYGFRPNTLASATIQKFSDCTFDATGVYFPRYNTPADGGWNFSRCSWVNSIGYTGNEGLPVCLHLAGNPPTTGTCLVDLCSFDRRVELTPNGATYKNSYLGAAFDLLEGIGGSPGVWALFDSNFIHHGAEQASRSSAPPIHYEGDVTNCYILANGRVQTPSYSGTASGGANQTDSGTITAAVAPGWTLSQWQDNGNTTGGVQTIYHVVLTGGTGAGQVRAIVDSTAASPATLVGVSVPANSLLVRYPWDTIPDGTTTFNIYFEWSNMHMMTSGGDTFSTMAVRGCIFDHTGADSEGDYIDDFSGARTFTIAKNHFLPNAARDNGGAITTGAGTASYDNTIILFEHNTYFTGTQCFNMGEGAPPANAANRITSYRANIAWCDPARESNGVGYTYTLTHSFSASSNGPYKVVDVGYATSLPGGSTQDVISANAADYNCGYGFKATSFGGKGYQINCSVAPGAHDVDADPQFVDRWRNFAKWAVTRGSTGAHVVTQVADGLGYLKADPSLIASSLVPYVRAGFRPQNSALNHASYPTDAATTDADGNAYSGVPDIGAMAVVSSGSPGNASGTAPVVSLASIATTATGAASATETAPALSFSVLVGTATGVAVATGVSSAISSSVPAGTATGGTSIPGNASGAVPAISSSVPVGIATGAAASSGVAPALSLSAPAGAASGDSSIPGVASGAAPALSLSGVLGAATGVAVATGVASAISLGAPPGTAVGLAATPGNASGFAPAISLAVPLGGASGMLVYITTAITSKIGDIATDPDPFECFIEDL